MKIHYAAIVFAILHVQAVTCCGQEVNKLFDLPYGTYHPGFNHYVKEDKSRTYERIYDWSSSAIFRQIPVSIWYPAFDNVNTPRMTVGSYLTVLKEEEEWEDLPDDRILSWFYYPNNEANRVRVTLASKAKRNSAAAPGKFPVIIYAASYEASSVENFMLCEFLASHGYIVVASPSRGADNRFLAGGSPKDVETQARDIEFLIGEVASMENADMSQLAVAGFSMGGISNVLAQMRNSMIRAVVCLDGTVKYHPEKLFASPFADISRMDVPFLFMSQKDIPENVLNEEGIKPEMNSNFAFFDSLRFSDAWYLKFLDLSHSNFSSMAILLQERDLRQEKSDAEILRSYRWMTLYTLNFLNATLRKDVDATVFIEKSASELNAEKIVTIKKKKGSIKDFTFDDFNALARSRHYTSLDSLYRHIQMQYTTFTADEWKMNNLGLQLLFMGQKTEAINVLEFNAALYPRSANAFDTLGEAYMHQGDTEMAIRYFKMSLKLDPNNPNAITKLQTLQKKKPAR
jgi:tetratricopeptide (TPR) repeat protein